MGIEVEMSGTLQKSLQKILDKYPLAANQAARKAGFLLQSIVVKDFLTIADGVAVRRKGVRPDKRTTWPGLRRRTGTLARAIKVGVYNGLSFEIITSENSGKLQNSILSGVAVGIGGDVEYGVIQERGGREQSGRKDSGRNFYPFLAPALQSSTRKISNIFDSEFRKAQKAT